MVFTQIVFILSVLIIGLFSEVLSADETEIRQRFSQHLQHLGLIDEINQSPVSGLWEIRIGSQIFYSDSSGRYVVQGELIDIQQQVNLTQQRINQVTAFDFDQLPFDDAVVWKQGKGSRKLVVFADPNCGFCKRFEQELNNVEDITVYTFLIPILGGDSPQKTQSVWCAKNPVMAWRSWMVEGVPLEENKNKECDLSAMQRNIALSEKHAVAATPMLVFENNVRVPGMLNVDDLESYFAAAHQ